MTQHWRLIGGWRCILFHRWLYCPHIEQLYCPKCIGEEAPDAYARDWSDNAALVAERIGDEIKDLTEEVMPTETSPNFTISPTTIAAGQEVMKHWVGDVADLLDAGKVTPPGVEKAGSGHPFGACRDQRDDDLCLTCEETKRSVEMESSLRLERGTDREPKVEGSGHECAALAEELADALDSDWPQGHPFSRRVARLCGELRAALQKVAGSEDTKLMNFLEDGYGPGLISGNHKTLRDAVRAAIESGSGDEQRAGIYQHDASSKGRCAQISQWPPAHRSSRL